MAPVGTERLLELRSGEGGGVVPTPRYKTAPAPGAVLYYYGAFEEGSAGCFTEHEVRDLLSLYFW